MVVLVKWNFNLFVNDGKPLTLDGSIDGITAYDKLSIKVPKEGSEPPTGTTVDLQPSVVDNLFLLCIRSDVYQAADGSNKLTYNLSNVTGANDNELLGPHVLIGNALVKLLGDDLTKLKFINTTAKDANIEVVVGRKA